MAVKACAGPMTPSKVKNSLKEANNLRFPLKKNPDIKIVIKGQTIHYKTGKYKKKIQSSTVFQGEKTELILTLSYD